MSDVAINQPTTGSLTYILDCTNRLAKAYPGQTITITSATGTIASPAVMSAQSGTGTSMTFHLATSGVTPPSVLQGTLTLTLSNGDVDPMSLALQVVSAT